MCALTNVIFRFIYRDLNSMARILASHGYLLWCGFHLIFNFFFIIIIG